MTLQGCDPDLPTWPLALTFEIASIFYKKEVVFVCKDCVTLHRRLKELSNELFQVKRANSRLKGEVRHERQEKEKLLKDRREDRRQHYRNGQKRGRTRNG